jgi:hypothetical protein
MQAEIDMLRKSNEQHNQREEWYLEMLRKFHHEMIAVGLSCQSEACQEVCYIYSSNSECSVQTYLESKQQGGAE